MIEDYISASRRTKPATSEIIDQYKKYYKLLALQLPFGMELPELTVVYSADRRCELVTIGKGRRYLIYDQYLGQSFNKLNRNQVSAHSRDQLSKAYASKYLAEKLLLKGETARATVLALLSVGFYSHVKEKGVPYIDTTNEDERRRLDYIVTQEIFVLAHEIGHLLYFANRNADKKPEDHIKECLLEFINQSKINQDKYDRLVQRYGKKLADEALAQDSEDHYSDTIEKHPELIAEVFADQIGALMTYRVATEYFEIDPDIVVEGLVLGHKYLRLFHALDTLADKLCSTNWGSAAANVSSLDEQLKDCVWKGKYGNIRITQLREHFLRSELLDFGGFAGVKGELNNLQDIVDAYDEHTEFPILFGLVDVLLEKKTMELLEVILESGKTEDELRDDVDSITGWA
jgi:hypothetical protein